MRSTAPHVDAFSTTEQGTCLDLDHRTDADATQPLLSDRGITDCRERAMGTLW